MALRGGTIAALDNVVGVSDMCLLESVNEDTFIENLSSRFKRAQIYVSVSQDLDCISVSKSIKSKFCLVNDKLERFG